METNTMNADMTNKFDLVLDALTKHEYKVSNDVYFDMFITHLAGKSGCGKRAQNKNIFFLYFVFISINSFSLSHIQMDKKYYRNNDDEKEEKH